ncbi:hypothetical protein SSX86_006352 [Deinandra increscens subsp. villosa]|uniref:Myb/SANT-like domain-containing protein n=1 Tax=Deinandra increscens subsp. villosa TaxID=3103831 RepID=A0AAP0DIQ0_9ASTR
MDNNDSRQTWTDDSTKFLLESCVEEFARVGRNGSSLLRESWDVLGKKLKERFGMNLQQKQIRNAFDTCKAKYVGWCYLRNKTGNLYDPRTNMFTLTSQEWEDFKKGHPRAMSLKSRPLPHLDLHIAVFDGLSATGANQWTSTQTSGVSSSPHVQTLQIQDSSFHNLEDDDGDSHGQGFPNDGDSHGQGFQNDDETPSNDDRAKSKANDDGGRSKKKAKVNLDELATDMQQALKHMVKSREGPSVEECYEKLKLVGLDHMDPLFLGAFNIFGRSMEMRQAWMTLPLEPEVLKGWLKITGTTYGMFK